MKLLVTFLFFLMANCTFGQTQADMNKAAYAEYQKADKELNEVYKKILVEYKADPAFISNLKASQRIWVSFRDAELKMMYPDREDGYYGSLHPVCRANYLAQLTQDRIKVLRRWLSSVEEEDACSSSIKTK